MEQAFGRLTYPFALEALEADFYTRVANGSAFTGANETQGVDGKATPQQVLAVAGPFIAESASITVTGTTA